MKKLTAVLLLLAALLAACAAPNAQPVSDTSSPAASDGGTAAPESVSVQDSAASDESFTLTYRGVRLTPGGTVDIEALLGAPDDRLEAPSCTHDGNDILYYYEGVEIVTSPSANGETLYSVSVLGEDIPTEEGLSIGMSAEDALRLYGEGTEAFGQYVFVRGAASLKIMTDADGTVTSITYIQNP